MPPWSADDIPSVCGPDCRRTPLPPPHGSVGVMRVSVIATPAGPRRSAVHSFGDTPTSAPTWVLTRASTAARRWRHSRSNLSAPGAAAPVAFSVSAQVATGREGAAGTCLWRRQGERDPLTFGKPLRRKQRVVEHACGCLHRVRCLLCVSQRGGLLEGTRQARVALARMSARILATWGTAR